MYIRTIQSAFILVLFLACLPSATAQNRADTARAVKLAEKARVSFAEDKFLDAAGFLESAYAIYPEPNFVWNIARAYEQAGESSKALENYERFSKLDVPENEREAALERVTRYRAASTLSETIKNNIDRAEIEHHRRLRSDSPQPVVSGTSPVGMSLAEVGGWTGVGLGMISLGAVATLHLASIGTVEQYNEAAAQGVDRGRYDALKDTLDARAATSQVLLGTGLILTVAGGTLLYLEYFGAEQPAPDDIDLSASPFLGSDSAGFVISGQF